MQLNPQQKAVVEATTGPVLVIAGAGSGKTRVIINKIKYLLSKGIKDSNIYAVTFTNKAAAEMTHRLRSEIKQSGLEEGQKVHISTFHTLGLEIIKAEHRAFNLKQKVILIDQADQTTLLRDILSNTKGLHGELDDEVELLRSFISAAKDALLLPGDMPSDPTKFTKNPFWIERYVQFTRLYHYYFAYLQSISCLDFDDLILLPTMLLKFNDKIRAKYNRKIKYLLVDEYQDTNSTQYELVKLLVGDKPNFTVVGDDDQSIYSWRGAKPENLERLGKDFPDLRVYFLEQNYRCTEVICEAANALIANNDHIYEKKLRAFKAGGKPIKVYAHLDDTTEAEAVVMQIKKHMIDHNQKPGNYAVLYRGNFQARHLERFFNAHEIPIAINGDSSFFEKPEVKDMIAYLRFIANPDDDKSMMRIINVPRRDIGPRSVVKIGEIAKKNGTTFFEACFNDELEAAIPGHSFHTLQDFVDLILHVGEDVNNTGEWQILAEFFDNLRYEDYLASQTDSKSELEQQLKNIGLLFDWVRNWMDPNGEGLSLTKVCQRLFLREMYANQNKDNAGDFVQLMTLHASKGLEFPYVHIIGCAEDLLPHKTSIAEDNVAEERRLMYVGITRAQDELTLHRPSTRVVDGVNQDAEISRFINEIPEEYLEVHAFDPEEAKQQRHEATLDALESLMDSL